MIALAVEEFGTTPGSLEVYLYTLASLTAGIVTAAKGRYVWLAVGLILLGLPWFVSAVLLARPGSMWANALYGPEKLSRAERRASRRLPRVRA